MTRYSPQTGRNESFIELVVTMTVGTKDYDRRQPNEFTATVSK